MLLVFLYAGKPLIRFVSMPDRFQAWVDFHGMWARAAFVGMVILQIFAAVIPGEPLEIAAGYAFGFWEGTFLCILGMTLGGTAVFCFVRKFGTKAVEVFIPKEKLLSYRFMQDEKRTFRFLAAAFLIPGTPKDVLSYCAGLSNIRFSQWILISSLCRLPSVVTSTIGGSALGAGNTIYAVIVFMLTLCVSLAGLHFYNRCYKKHRKK